MYPRPIRPLGARQEPTGNGQAVPDCGHERMGDGVERRRYGRRRPARPTGRNEAETGNGREKPVDGPVTTSIYLYE